MQSGLLLEKSFRMAKSDLQARPVYHHQRDSIEAHLTIVFAALAVSRWIEHQTGWSIRKFVKTARRYRTIEIQAGDHVITAADPIPDDLPQPLPRSTPPGAVRTSLIKVGSCGTRIIRQLSSPVIRMILRRCGPGEARRYGHQADCRPGRRTRRCGGYDQGARTGSAVPERPAHPPWTFCSHKTSRRGSWRSPPWPREGCPARPSRHAWWCRSALSTTPCTRCTTSWP